MKCLIGIDGRLSEESTNANGRHSTFFFVAIATASSLFSFHSLVSFSAPRIPLPCFPIQPPPRQRIGRKQVQLLSPIASKSGATLPLSPLSGALRLRGRFFSGSRFRFAQAAAAAQAGASVIQIFIGRIRDWSRNHTGDPEMDAAIRNGEDPGLKLVTKAYNYIHKYGNKSKLMVAAIRNKQDIFSLLGVDYMIVPLKIMQSLKDSITYPDEKYSFVRRLSASSATSFNFSQEEIVNWDQTSFSSAVGLESYANQRGRLEELFGKIWPPPKELLAAGLESNANQRGRLEELFGKIWPPPNV